MQRYPRCSGKATFGNWLRDQNAFLHLDLESRDCLAANGPPRFWPARIWNLDEAGLAEFVTCLHTLDPLNLDAPRLRVDTTQGYAPNLDQIVAFARNAT